MGRFVRNRLIRERNALRQERRIIVPQPALDEPLLWENLPHQQVPNWFVYYFALYPLKFSNLEWGRSTYATYVLIIQQTGASTASVLSRWITESLFGLSWWLFKRQSCFIRIIPYMGISPFHTARVSLSYLRWLFNLQSRHMGCAVYGRLVLTAVRVSLAFCCARISV
jgi:hypothetical protein